MLESRTASGLFLIGTQHIVRLEMLFHSLSMQSDLLLQIFISIKKQCYEYVNYLILPSVHKHTYAKYNLCYICIYIYFIK
jgi:hypothetical protein